MAMPMRSVRHHHCRSDLAPDVAQVFEKWSQKKAFLQLGQFMEMFEVSFVVSVTPHSSSLIRPCLLQYYKVFELGAEGDAHDMARRLTQVTASGALAPSCSSQTPPSATLVSSHTYSHDLLL